MLVTCPECERSISDRAVTCPGCGFPWAEHRAALVAQEAIERDRSTRVAQGEVDCVRCEARGFRVIPKGEVDAGAFEWCAVCNERGRVVLCHSDRGYFAVARAVVEEFVAGRRDDGGLEVVYLGAAPPPPHRYPPPPDDDG